MTQLQETINGQILNALPGATILWTPMGEDRGFPLHFITIRRERDLTGIINILHVSEMNIKWRRSKEEPDNATWIIRGISEDDEERMLEQLDAVMVSYGAAADGGEFWEESSGNPRKGSYRRLGYVDSLETGRIEKGPLGYPEIKTTCTEANLRRLWAGEPLEDRCDYPN